MIGIQFGFQENLGHAKKDKFDSINFDLDRGIFVLCDGANSTPWGGEASKLCSLTVLEGLKNGSADDKLKTINVFDHSDLLIKKQYKSAACTCISAEVLPDGISLASCGDSLIELYTFRSILGWNKAFSSKLDLIENTQSPSQLLGSPAYSAPNLHLIKPKSVFSILLMSDGLYRYTTSADRLKMVKKIGRHTPSNEDLSYLSSEISLLAMKNHSLDDISIGIIWGYFR